MTRPVVRRSIEDAGGTRCVDLVERDGRFGWSECRRDPEDGHGWRRMQPLEDFPHADADAALEEARGAVPWLDAVT